MNTEVLLHAPPAGSDHTSPTYVTKKGAAIDIDKLPRLLRALR